jgi:hypothetical protein
MMTNTERKLLCAVAQVLIIRGGDREMRVQLHDLLAAMDAEARQSAQDGAEAPWRVGGATSSQTPRSTPTGAGNGVSFAPLRPEPDADALKRAATAMGRGSAP